MATAIEAQLAQVQALLAADPASLDARLEGLDDAALDAEITRYRDVIGDVTRQLQELGGCRRAAAAAA